jgi:ArsR family transcriptional regulator
MDPKRLARVYAALGSDIRLRLINFISAHKEMCICELVDQLDMSQANISRHVSILRDAGILQDRKVGTWVLLRVDESALKACSAELVAIVKRNHEASRSEDAEKRLEERCTEAQPA